MKTKEIILSELDAKIPRSAVDERDGGGGRKLSYLSGWYVIDRLNKVFGQGNWCYASEVTLIREDKLTKQAYGKDTEYHSVHYTARVTLNVRLSKDEPWTDFIDYGYGDGADTKVPGKAHELAIKEAVTDGLKRCAKNLGMSLGLALYDKSQEFVDDEEVKEAPKVAAATVSMPVEKPVETTQSTDRRPTIRAAMRVLISQNKATTDSLKDRYKFDKLAQLSDNDADGLYNSLKTDYPELKLN